MDTIQVKIGKLGARSVEYTLQENATIQDLLNAAAADNNAYDLAGYQLRLNRETASVTSTVEDGDIVSLIPAVKGG